ncbi:MAG: 4-oxalomesaconate tautomerase [Ilumatobacteraceae bacterium]
MLMRGGTSKGAYFLRDDLPADTDARDLFLMRMMGTPDARQIDGIGGAHPLTSKVAVVWRSASDAADVEYLFLQLGVDQPFVTDRQNCGNLLAGVAPFAIERGIVEPGNGSASVRIHMINTDSIAIASLAVADGRPVYAGDTSIAGVPGTAAPIRLDFTDIAGGSCGALLPTGRAADVIADVAVTLIDNGMPVVVMRATDLDVSGYEEPAELEANQPLRSRLEDIRLQAGKLMNLGDVTAATVPKLTLVAPPRDGGSISTRTFIPHRVHDAIGVLGAVSVATAALLPDSPAHGVLAGGRDGLVVVEHPTGTFDASIDVTFADDGTPEIGRAGIIRTARKLMDGVVFPRDY